MVDDTTEPPRPSERKSLETEQTIPLSPIAARYYASPNQFQPEPNYVSNTENTVPVYYELKQNSIDQAPPTAVLNPYYPATHQQGAIYGQ